MASKLKPIVKRAKVFLIQKNTRKIATLKYKKGTEVQIKKNHRKAKRLHEEIKVLKNLNLDQFAGELLSAVQDSNTNRIAFNGGSLEEKVKQELVEIKVLKNKLTKCAKKKKHNNIQQFIKSELRVPSTTESLETFSNSSDTSNIADDIPKMELLEEQESHSFLSSGTEDEGNTFQTTPNSDLKTKGEVKQPNMASMFVESLASKEILKDKSKVKKTANHSKCRSNRLGQRARRRLWEEKYGARAKHVVSSERKLHIKAKRGKTVNKHSTPYTPSSSRPKVVVVGNKDESLSEKMHPSWSAKKRQTRMASSIGQFCGKKTTFSD